MAPGERPSLRLSVGTNPALGIGGRKRLTLEGASGRMYPLPHLVWAQRPAAAGRVIASNAYASAG